MVTLAVMYVKANALFCVKYLLILKFLKSTVCIYGLSGAGLHLPACIAAQVVICCPFELCSV